jgi:ethanolamine ammonia-lyase small subunit
MSSSAPSPAVPPAVAGTVAATPAPAAIADPWSALRAHTPARLALGRAGLSLPTEELLRFSAAHAQARDAVHLPLDAAVLTAELEADGFAVRCLRSRAANRETYLRRPDLGRRLDPADAQALQADAGDPVDLAVVVADGLSARAAQAHARPLLIALRAALAAAPGAPPLHWAPVCIATQARVALGDEIGALLQARLVLVLLGERPGLSSPDSLGAYLSHGPRVGCLDADRNCVSNIRPAGLVAGAAAQRLAWLVREALRLRLTGVALKDGSETALIGG